MTFWSAPPSSSPGWTCPIPHHHRDRADRFGLTQLYQLRGRVGRGANLAYAYFLYEGGKRLTPVAHKRLRTIYEATGLGAGYGIA